MEKQTSNDEDIDVYVTSPPNEFVRIAKRVLWGFYFLTLFCALSLLLLALR